MVRDDTTNNNPDTTAATTTTTSSSKVLVQAYSHARQIYWVSPIIEKVSTADEDTSGANDDDSGSNNNKHTSPWLANASSNNNLLSLATQGTAMTTSDAPFLEYPITAMQPATAAKFYPVLETLMRRGEETAAAARQFWQANPATQSVVQKTGQALQKAATLSATAASDATTALQQHVTPTVHVAKDKVELKRKLEEIHEDLDLAKVLEGLSLSEKYAMTPALPQSVNCDTFFEMAVGQRAKDGTRDDESS